jgi:hypothetical protein
MTSTSISPRTTRLEATLETPSNTLPVSSTGPAFDEDPEIAARLVEWEQCDPDAVGEEAWLSRMVVVQSIAFDKAQRQELAVRDHVAQRARLVWDADRILDAEELGAKLARSKAPGKTVARLKNTKHGCQWLIARWTSLGLDLQRDGAWSEPRQSFVLDLLGIPRDEREHPFEKIVPDPQALVHRQVEELSRLIRVALTRLDEDERLYAQAGVPISAVPILAQAERRNGACLRAFKWAYEARAELRQTRPPAPPKPTPPAPAPRRQPQPLPPAPPRVTNSLPNLAPPETAPAPAPLKGNRRARKAAMRRERES